MRFKNILRDYGRDFKNYLKIPFESTLPQHTGLIDKQRLLFTEDENKSYLGKSVVVLLFAAGETMFDEQLTNNDKLKRHTTNKYRYFCL